MTGILYCKSVHDLREKYLNIKNFNKISFFKNMSPTTVVIYKALCFDEAQGRMNGAPNKTRTHSLVSRFHDHWPIKIFFFFFKILILSSE